MLRWALTLTGLLLAAGPLLACSLCGRDIQQRTTLRLEAGLPQARLILVGTVQSSVIDEKTGRGTTKFQVTSTLKKDSAVGEPKVVEVPEYLPTNTQLILFCDISSGRIDPYRRIVVSNGDKSIDYVRKSLALDPKDRTAALQFYSEHFEDADREVAADAFLEFAKATDAEVGQVASKRKLDVAKLRRILSDPKTPAERLSVYAALLGACGTEEDAAFLARCLDDVRNDRIINSYDGYLGGYISLKPEEGWKRAEKILADKNPSSLPIRLSVMRTLRYQMGAHADRRAEVLRCSETVLRQGDLADIAIEDLRRWKVWDRTPQVLAQYDRKDITTPPVVKEAVVRFAIQAAASQPGAQTFLADRERLEPELVRAVRESLKYQPE